MHGVNFALIVTRNGIGAPIHGLNDLSYEVSSTFDGLLSEVVDSVTTSGIIPIGTNSPTTIATIVAKDCTTVMPNMKKGKKCREGVNFLSDQGALSFQFGAAISLLLWS